MPKRRVNLEVLCLRQGSLDVDVLTGEVFSVRRGAHWPMKLREDKDGYLCFGLNRDSKSRGKACKCKRTGKVRYRVYRWVRVNRLVKIKAMAIAKGGRNWRKFVADLPLGVDVNHIDTDRQNNNHENLELSTERANRARKELSEEELAKLQAAGW